MRSSPDVVTDAAKSLQEALQGQTTSWGDSCHQFIERAKKRLAKADADLLRLQAEGQTQFEALRTEARVTTLAQPKKNLGSEMQRMQRVIDDLMGARQGEIKILMDLGTVESRSVRIPTLRVDQEQKVPA